MSPAFTLSSKSDAANALKVCLGGHEEVVEIRGLGPRCAFSDLSQLLLQERERFERVLHLRRELHFPELARSGVDGASSDQEAALLSAPDPRL
jgi:hypothetical protein